LLVCLERQTSSTHDLLLAGVVPEGSGWSELAELVTNHRLGEEHGDVLTPIVNRDRVADHVGGNRRTARPGLDHLVLAGRVLTLDLQEKVLINKWAFF